jgi:hypothetical protein
MDIEINEDQKKVVLQLAAKFYGQRGGKANTARQNAARRRNGKLGGRPRKQRAA